jgi:hypothetical protein
MTQFLDNKDKNRGRFLFTHCLRTKGAMRGSVLPGRVDRMFRRKGFLSRWQRGLWYIAIGLPRGKRLSIPYLYVHENSTLLFIRRGFLYQSACKTRVHIMPHRYSLCRCLKQSSTEEESLSRSIL